MRGPAVSFDCALLYLCTYIHTHCNVGLFMCVQCMTICIMNNGDTCSIL